MLQTIFGSISGIFKIAISYSYLNKCSPFHHFYADLKILQNYRLLIKGFCLEGGSFTAIALVFYPVGMTKYQKWSLPILLNWCKLQLLRCLLAIQSILFQFNNPSKHEASNNRVVYNKNFKAIVSLVQLVGLFKYCKSCSFIFKTSWYYNI